MLTPRTDKSGKCPAVARGGGGRALLELTDALLYDLHILMYYLLFKDYNQQFVLDFSEMLVKWTDKVIQDFL